MAEIAIWRVGAITCTIEHFTIRVRRGSQVMIRAEHTDRDAALRHAEFLRRALGRETVH